MSVPIVNLPIVLYCVIHKQRRLTQTMKKKPDMFKFLTLCMLHNFFDCLLILISLKVNIFKANSGLQPYVSNSLDPDQVRQSGGPNLDPNCLQSLSAYSTSIKELWNIHCSNNNLLLSQLDLDLYIAICLYTLFSTFCSLKGQH